MLIPIDLIDWRYISKKCVYFVFYKYLVGLTAHRSVSVGIDKRMSSCGVNMSRVTRPCELKSGKKLSAWKKTAWKQETKLSFFDLSFYDDACSLLFLSSNAYHDCVCSSVHYQWPTWYDHGDHQGLADLCVVRVPAGVGPGVQREVRAGVSTQQTRVVRQVQVIVRMAASRHGSCGTGELKQK